MPLQRPYTTEMQPMMMHVSIMNFQESLPPPIILSYYSVHACARACVCVCVGGGGGGC